MKNNFLNKSIVILIFSLIYALQVHAQVIDEWEARPNVSLKYKFNKAWSVTGTYYLYLEENFSRYNKSVIGADVGYKINSWLKASIDYRYGIDSKENYHDIRYSVTFDFNSPSKKWKFEYRPMLQQEFVSLKKDHFDENPVEYFLRNRVTVNYFPAKNIELYLFTENYVQPVEGDIFFHRQKNALGGEYKLNARNKIGARFEYINKKSGKNVARPNLSYTYTL